MISIAAIRPKYLIAIVLLWNAIIGVSIVLFGREQFGLSANIACIIMGIFAICARQIESISLLLYGVAWNERGKDIRSGLLFLSILSLLFPAIIIGMLLTHP